MMLQEHLDVHYQVARRLDTRRIWEIADGRYGMDRTRPPGERWHVVTMPWCRKIYDHWQDAGVQELCVRAGSQTWKTTMFLIACAWSIRYRAVPKLWITAKDDLAKDLSQERLQPTLQRSPDLKDLLFDNRLDTTTYKIRTKLCTVDIAGAESSTALEQNPYGEIFADECRNYPGGYLTKLRMRQRNYQDAKRALFSTPAYVGDEFDQRCNLGSQFEWLFPCQKCGQLIPLVWSLKYSRLPEQYRKLSQMMFPKDVAEAWLECACNHRHMDVPGTRRWILDQGDWVPMNLATDPELRDLKVESFHYPAMLCPNTKWYDLAQGFRQAVRNMKAGNLEDLRLFVNESLGEPWRDGQHIEDSEITKASYKIEVVTSSEWQFVFMTCDVGKYDFWHVVRGWNPGAQSRILSAGQLRYWEDINAIAKQFGLVMAKRNDEGLAEGLSRRVFIDARYEDPNNQEVHRHAAEHGWTCFIDTDKVFFEIKDERTNERQRFLYSPPRYFDSKTGAGGRPNIKGVEFSIATNTAQDILDELLAKKVGKFEHPDDFENGFVKFSAEQYDLHMRNEPKIPRTNPKDGRVEYYRKRIGPQHLRACEWMQVVAASMPKLIAALPILEERQK
jgi:hypothetical protein